MCVNVCVVKCSYVSYPYLYTHMLRRNLTTIQPGNQPAPQKHERNEQKHTPVILSERLARARKSPFSFSISSGSTLCSNDAAFFASTPSAMGCPGLQSVCCKPCVFMRAFSDAIHLDKSVNRSKHDVREPRHNCAISKCTSASSPHSRTSVYVLHEGRLVH